MSLPDYTAEHGDYGTIIHTFDTEQNCQVQCQVQCSMHHFSDLMMQRWLCPLKELDKNYILDRTENTTSGFTIFLIICAILMCLLFFIFGINIIRQRLVKSRSINEI
ncbi:unnamed protein product [Dracunculus medinensis]|uniref:Apple domain-containing protein n=1 Tax=Dracunculus medinensis TaxID=318479 RepID=A0A0N4UBT1_DRAME|nr:unnamed protein product [Dracunculus medinensis]